MNKGYATLFSVVILAIITVFSFMVLSSSSNFNVYIKNEKVKIEERSKLLETLDKILKALADDRTPFINSPDDNVWSVLDSLNNSEQKVFLKDISSALNINAIGEEYLKQQEFTHQFNSVHSAEEIHKFLLQNGPFRSLKEAEDHVASIDGNYFTVHGYWNPYLVDTELLASLFVVRGWDKGKASQIAAALKFSADTGNLSEASIGGLLGSDEKGLRALLTSEGLINIHFVEEQLLRSIMNLKYNGKRLPNRGKSISAVLAARLRGSVSRKYLENTIEREAGQDDILRLLGCETWFWKLDIERKNLNLTAIIAKSTKKDLKGFSRFQVIYRQFQNRL